MKAETKKIKINGKDNGQKRPTWKKSQIQWRKMREDNDFIDAGALH